jgi:hypothetical protein
MEVDFEAGRIGKCRLRYYDTGVVYLSRNDRDATAWMDKHMVRLDGQLAWRPKCVFPEDRSVSELKPHFGNHAYIVGKGKSADNLSADNFPTKDPIIGVNEAFIAMEKLELPNMIFGTRQDAARGVTMPATTATMIIHSNILPIYSSYPRTYVFNAKKDFGMKHSSATVIVAIGFAIAMGVKVITMYGFDSYTVGSVEYGDMQNVNNKNSNNLHLLKQSDQLRLVNTDGVLIRWVTPDLENYLTEV